MKKIRKCDFCAKDYDYSRDTSKFCSTACRVEDYRKKNNIEKPDFLQQKSLGNVSDVEWETVEETKEKKIKEKNPEYVQVEEIISNKQIAIKEIQTKKNELISEYSKMVETEKITQTLGAGSGLILGALLSQKQDDPVNKLLTIAGFGVGGYLLGDGIGTLLSSQFKRKILSLEQEINYLSGQENNIQLQLSSLNNRKNRLNEFFIKTELHTELVKRAKAVVIPKLDNLVPVMLEKTPSEAKLEAITTNELAKMEFESLILKEPYSSMLGAISDRFTMMIYGTPGAGKSTFALKFAHNLSNSLGRVIVLSTEEGICQSLQRKINQFNLQSNDLVVATKETTKDILKAELTGFRFILIDSVNDANLTPQDLKDLKSKYPKSCYILIFQSTKDGNFRGDQKFLHDVDIQIKVDSGQATTEKNRYSVVGKSLEVY